MSNVFKRPMFRKGGEVGGGITSGMRNLYASGNEKPSEKDLIFNTNSFVLVGECHGTRTPTKMQTAWFRRASSFLTSQTHWQMHLENDPEVLIFNSL